MKLAEATGKAAAAGLMVLQLDFDTAQKGVAGRNTARDGQSMVAAEGAFMFREKQAEFAQAVANQNAYNRVRPPSFGPAPAAPMGRERMADNTGRDLMFGLGTAVLDGVAAGFGAAPKTSRMVPTGTIVPGHYPAGINPWVVLVLKNLGQQTFKNVQWCFPF